jgi:hypothetical protein
VGRAKNRSAKGLPGECGGLSELEHLIIRRVGGLGDFLGHDILFARQILLIKGGAQDEIGTWKLVRSWPVAALIWPPSASTASTISRADRPPAPLKTICSRRCDQPQRASSSQRAPRPATTLSASV